MSINELCDKAQIRYNRWQKIYDRSNDDQAKCLMWFYAGQLQAYADMIMKGDSNEEH